MLPRYRRRASGWRVPWPHAGSDDAVRSNVDGHVSVAPFIVRLPSSAFFRRLKSLHIMNSTAEVLLRSRGATKPNE